MRPAWLQHRLSPWRQYTTVSTARAWASPSSCRAGQARYQAPCIQPHIHYRRKHTRASKVPRQLRRSGPTPPTDKKWALSPQSPSGTQSPMNPDLAALSSPPVTLAARSTKLAALHARLALPTRLPIETLARTLVDKSADGNAAFNNESLAILGDDILGYHTAEHIISTYPRLPMAVIFAAQAAYVGPRALTIITREWGVEPAVAPGGEVDPGFLQFTRVEPGLLPPAPPSIRPSRRIHPTSGTLPSPINSRQQLHSLANQPAARQEAEGEELEEQDSHLDGKKKEEGEVPVTRRRRLVSLARMKRDQEPRPSRIIDEDQFGGFVTRQYADPSSPTQSSSLSSSSPSSTSTSSSSPSSMQRDSSDPSVTSPPQILPITLEQASTSFVRALVGAIYTHCGRAAAKTFHAAHFLSRRLDMAALFDLRQPHRDLYRLCAREGFEPPIARLIAETGRQSRHPVFVVGIYSGKDKLGEGAGASLDEARFRANAAAMKAWYLYSPLDTMLPSDVEGGDEAEEARKRWKPLVVDWGELVS